MGLFDFIFQLGCVTEILMLPIKLIAFILKHFAKECVLLFIALAASVLWVDFYDVSVLTMELNLLSKLGLDISYDIYEVVILMGLYFVLICFRKISQWTRAALYGCITSFAVSTLEFLIRMEVPDFRFPRIIIFMLVLIISVLLMYIGFHRTDCWIGPGKETLGMIVGIIPSLLYSFISICTLFTITFGDAVIDKFSFVIFAVIFEIILYGVGIFLYFRFNWIYREKMLKKLGIEEEGYTVETKVLLGGDNTEE